MPFEFFQLNNGMSSEGIQSPFYTETNRPANKKFIYCLSLKIKPIFGKFVFLGKECPVRFLSEPQFLFVSTVYYCWILMEVLEKHLPTSKKKLVGF